MQAVGQLVHNKFSELLQTQPAICPTLQQALTYVLFTKGKKLRPNLVYATAEFFIKPTTVNNNLILNSATALELIHIYSLVHDDLPAMDNDDYRRGQLSCHKKFNEATAILVGDCLQTMAFNLLSNNIYDSELQLKIIALLSQAAGQQGMVGGQSLELNSPENQKNININLLNKIHLHKTGKLISCALNIGAILSHCDNNQLELIAKLGNTLGLIYQIQDDIQDYPNTQNNPCYVAILSLPKAQQILDQLILQSQDILKQLSVPPDSMLYKVIFTIIQRVATDKPKC
ncbi:MAG: polyprenyl synthetase family protein [Gammaproteobacteria bacterium]|nr:polyprenyl synthetase family protein [Gammaproteobacteria bacterium]